MRMRAWNVILIAVVTTLGLGLNARGEDWPQWRGPDGQGHAATKNVPIEFGESKAMTWKTPLDARGHSSPVIEGDQIWFTTARDTPATKAYADQRLKENTGNQPLTISSFLTLSAVCIDRNTGKMLHNIELMTVKDPQWVHQLNSYASPSPLIESGRLYCHFGTYGTACLDTKTGQVVWTNQSLHVMHENGPGSTPVLYGNKLIIHFDGSDKQFIAALDKATGKVAWQTARTGELRENVQLRKAYGTPLIMENGGKPWLISPAADWLYCYNPDTGEEIWKLGYETLGFSNVARPVVGHGMIYNATCFMQSQMQAVRYDGADGNAQPHIVWRYARNGPRMVSPLLVGNELYIVSDTGTLTCLNALTGDEHYSERLGGNYSSSPMYVDGRIYLASREGVVTVLQPGTTFKTIATNQLDGAIFATPAAVDGSLIYRTDKAIYRFDRAKAQ